MRAANARKLLEVAQSFKREFSKRELFEKAGVKISSSWNGCSWNRLHQLYLYKGSKRGRYFFSQDKLNLFSPTGVVLGLKSVYHQATVEDIIYARFSINTKGSKFKEIRFLNKMFENKTFPERHI